jgi:formylglycine-generating enzyme required for sulfatase activity
MDMAGNVAEWVGDRYGSDYYCKGPGADTTWPFEGECDYGEPAFLNPWINPTGPEDGEYFVLRGGDWWGTTPHRFVNLRASDREYDRGLTPYDTMTSGFRCCRSPLSIHP